MIRTQVSLPKSLYQSTVAKQEKRPAAQVIRDLLTSGLAQKQKASTIEQALLKLTNIHAHAQEDTSQKIDEYLYSNE
jgi:metal-responsive CopG/Arc/MetJ family transcriptional regulator